VKAYIEQREKLHMFQISATDTADHSASQAATLYLVNGLQ